MLFMPFRKTYFRPLLLLLVSLLTACGGHLVHRVERGETLYSIGWVYGYDYRQLARWNNIPPPYVLSPGQRIRVAPPSGQSAPPLQEYRDSIRHDKEHADTAVVRKSPAPVVNASTGSAKVVDKSHKLRKTKPVSQQHDAESVITAAKTAVKKLFNQSGIKLKKPAVAAKASWRWPTDSRRVVHTFSANKPSRQGLDIAGEMGSPVLAAATGRVVYAGSGLVRYGRLIIVKHNEKYLSAYAHNQKLRVKEGDVVKAGQRIADMGRSGNLGDSFKNGRRAKLHFEIRKNGKPVDPRRYLPR